MPHKRPRVVIFFGGNKESSDLSEQTGYWLCNYIPRAKYDITPVRINAEGNWQVPLGGLPQQGPVDRMMTMLFQGLRALPPAQGLERLLRQSVNAMLTTIRGHGGDDGALHILGKTLHIPVVGPSGATYQQTFHKQLCADRVLNIVSSPRSHFFRATAPEQDILDAVQSSLEPPYFIKPVSEEGSVGVETAATIAELLPAIARAKTKGDMLIQQRSPGTELNITMYQDDSGRVQLLPPTLIVPQHQAPFYDHLAKRYPGRARLHTPDRKNNPLVWQAETIARDVYDELGCEGYASVDLMTSDSGVELLEVNTVPTLTTLTPLKQQLKAAGVHPATMIDGMLHHTLQRGY